MSRCRTAPRPAPNLFLLILVTLAMLTGPFQALAAQTAGEKRAEATITVNGNTVQATLVATTENVAVELSTGQRFTAPNPLPAFTEVGLQPIPARGGDHLLVSVSDEKGTHGWVLIPGDTGLQLGLEVTADQSLTVMADLVIAANRTPRPGGGFTVGSRIYRYDPNTGKYEATKPPAGIPASNAAGNESHQDPAASEGTLMSRIQRYVYLGVAVLLALLCLFLQLRLNRSFAERARSEAELQAKLSKAEAEILSLRQEAADLKGQLLAARAGSSSGAEEKPSGGEHPLVLLNPADLAELKARGLKEPAADLVRALQERTDLIPMPARLGGTMTFEPPSNWVISHPWILAPFGDGHVGGRGLFKYTVIEGRVSFTLVDWIKW